MVTCQGLKPVAVGLLAILACQRIDEDHPREPESPQRESLDVIFGDLLAPDLLARARLADDFQLQFARVPGRSGVEKLLRVRGKSLRDILGPGRFGADEVARAARAVLLANADLLRTSSGTLVFDGVRLGDTSVRAVWRQIARLADGTQVPVAGSVLSVSFDARGSVAYVLRCLWDGVDGLPPAALGPGEARERVLAGLTSVPLRIERAGVTASEQVQFRARSAEVEGPIVYAGESGRPALAYLATVSGELLGLPESKKGNYGVYVGANDGALLDVFSTTVGLQDYSAKGTVRVYQNEPMYPDTVVAPVYHLDSSVFELEGQYVAAHNDAGGDPTDPNRHFDFFGLPFPDDWQRAVAEAYFAGDAAVTHYRSVGFQSLFIGPPAYVDALDVDSFQSNYYLATKTINLIPEGTAPDADDPGVTKHEFAHYFHHLVGGAGPYGYPFSLTDLRNRSVDEGLADYRATSDLNSTLAYPILAIQYGQPYLRLLNRDWNVLDNWSSNSEHHNGEILGTALWKLRRGFGKGIVDRSSLDVINCILPIDGFDEFLECLIQTDDSLYAGVHEDAIRRIFAFAKVYGANGSYCFTTNWIQSPQRPYPNTESSEQTLTLTGAAALGGIRLVLSNDSDVNLNDALDVRDGNGTLVASLAKGELANAVIVVPDSDVARLSIPSDPNDNLGGNGYNVVAAVPVNAPSSPPTFTLEVTPRRGMDPLPVTFRVTGPSLVAVTIATGDGSPDGHPEQINGAFEYAHVYNYDVNSGPIVQGRWFEPIVTVINDQGRQTTVTRRIWVNPYQLHGPWAAPAPTAPVPVGPCTLSPARFQCP